MAYPRHSDEFLIAVAEHRRQFPSDNAACQAYRSNKYPDAPPSWETYRGWVKHARARGILEERAEHEVALPYEPSFETQPAQTPESPKERRGEAFWKRRAKELESEVGALSTAVEALTGLRSERREPPTWFTSDAGKRSGSVLVAHTSDVHMGERILPGEIQGCNEFSADICEERMRRYYNAVCAIGQRWISDTECRGVLHTMGGDEISGNIHAELEATNDLTSNESVHRAVAMRVAGIRQLADQYGRVHTVAVPGNHGRQTFKPPAKLIAKTSYDMLIADLVALELREDDRCTFQLAEGTDVTLQIFTWNLLVTHGDNMGSSGGMGYIGPIAAIIRGVKKVRDQMASMGHMIDYILGGHFHTSCAIPGALFNGSVPGYSEYGNKIRARVEPPKQWLALLTENWGLRERLDVQLEEPRRPKPIHRVKALSEPA